MQITPLTVNINMFQSNLYKILGLTTPHKKLVCGVVELEVSIAHENAKINYHSSMYIFTL
jgi:hypothetical protein